MIPRPTKTQLAVWKDYFYRGLKQAEGMRRLKIKNRAAFEWRMRIVTQYLLSKNPPLV